jgi:hypothetical protein
MHIISIDTLILQKIRKNTISQVIESFINERDPKY